MKLSIALMVAALMLTPSLAQNNLANGDNAILKKMILSASPESWGGYGAQSAARQDATVQGGKAMRFTVTKGEHSWQAAASIGIPAPIAKGDVVLGAFWARVEEPAKGRTTAELPASIGLGKAPYTSFANDNVTASGTWKMYYVSGVADADYASGSLNLSVQLASDTQVIDLGPAFVLDFGLNYDITKLPRNQAVVAQAPTPAPAAVAKAADGLTQIRAKLPVAGTLINDPGVIYTYGAELSAALLATPEISGGQAKRVVVPKAADQPWNDGALSPITGAVKKGDVVFMAALVRAAEIAPSASTGTITVIGVSMSKSPWTQLSSASASLPKGAWTWVYASGTAAEDYPAGSLNFGMQLGCCQQTIDIGPVYVIDLGPGIALSALPANSSKP